MNKAAMGAFTAASAFGSLWGAYLVQLHQQAVAQTLEPGMLCGADGGCHTVLASEWSTVGGVAVSAPAFGLFGALAVLGGLALAGRVDAGPPPPPPPPTTTTTTTTTTSGEPIAAAPTLTSPTPPPTTPTLDVDYRANSYASACLFILICVII